MSEEFEVKEPETMEDFKEALESSFRKLSEGDLIRGTVMSVSEEEVILDLNYYAPGVIKADEISDDPSFSMVESIHPGDELEATIVRLDDGHGNLVLSQREANEVKGWDILKSYMDEKTILTVKVSGVVNAGVVTYLEGLRGFIPASQLSVDYVEDCNTYLGKELQVRVITVDKAQKKLVLSAKSVELELETEQKNKKISMIVPGTVVEGTVESLMPYGAFIRIGNGLSGLVHISQISEKRIKKPADVLEVGQQVKAKVINTNDNKISLSIRALQEEMVDTDAVLIEDVEKYTSKESPSTSLGDLLSKFKFD